MPTITIYTTAICPYCVRAKRLLKQKQVNYQEIRIDLNRDKIQEMIQLSKRTTVPQIFIGNYHVGGCDELYMLEREGKLDSLLNND